MNGKSCCSPGRAPVEGGGAGEFAKEAAMVERVRTGSTAGMVKIPGGEFLMGSADADGWAQDGEGPVRAVTVQGFFIDACCVTNEQFAEFVNATGYKTEAERFGWAYVFEMFLSAKERARVTQRVTGSEWWCRVEEATWRHPEGPGANIKQRWAHPVVQVSWNDAAAYAAWTGKRLPTESEWECAARGGLAQKRYPWGDELTPGGKHLCNIWQGIFPTQNTAEDGFVGTAPAKSFRANGFGLYNVAGNVWEWCGDWFSGDFQVNGPRENPAGPKAGERKVIRGGSYLCHASYCNRYRVGARSANTLDSATGNLGFRCVRDE